MLLSKDTVCNSERLRFFKEKDASELLSKVGIKFFLSKTPLFSQYFVLGVLMH